MKMVQDYLKHLVKFILILCLMKPTLGLCIDDCKLANQTYKTSCNKNPNQNPIGVVDIDAFCTSSCSNTQLELHHCHDPQTGLQIDCNLDHCKHLGCMTALTDNGYVLENICSDSGNFYTSRSAYCDDKIQNLFNSYRLCESQACQDPQQCAYFTCIALTTSYVPTCDNTLFNYHDSVEDWCEAVSLDKNLNNGCFDGSQPCDKEFCFKAKCQNQTDFKGACVIDTINNTPIWTQINTEIEFCSKEWLDEQSGAKTTHLCDDTCDCAIENCINETPSKICSKPNNEFYEDSKKYCEDVANGLTRDIQQCDGMPCESHEDCCEANCNDTPFDGACLNGIFKYFEIQEEFCEEKCGVTKAEDLTVLCAIGGQLCKDDCCHSNCMSMDYQTMCTVDYSLSVDQNAFCLFKGCGPDPILKPCDDPANCDCQMTKCMRQFDNYPHQEVLGFNSLRNYYVYYISTSQYCLFNSNSTGIEIVDIKPGYSVSQEYCFIQCEPKTTNFTGFACAADSFEEFTEKDDFCRKACEKAIQIPFGDQFEHASCDGTAGDCSKQQCCEERCELEDYETKCRTDTWGLLSKNDYCNLKCQNQNIFSGCEGDCEPQDCLQKKCEHDVIQAGSPPNYPVCGDNDILYPTIKSYCQENLEKGPFGYNQCGSKDCKDQCCQLNCMDDNQGYEGRCNDKSFIFYDKAEDYCMNYCKNDKQFEAYLCNSGADFCNESACCAKQCQEQEPTCRSDDYTLVPSPANCIDQCGQPNWFPLDCQNGCTQADCDQMKCINTVYGQHSFNNICALADKWYPNINLFCDDRLFNGGLFVPTCLGGPCTNDELCCQENCARSSKFSGGCSEQTFDWTDDKTVWCQWYCPTRLLEPFMVGNAVASKLECCLEKCGRSGYEAGCSLDFTEFIDKQKYCERHCADPSKIQEVFHCASGDCSPEQCQAKLCIEDLKARGYSSQYICGNNNKYYHGQGDYCEDLVAQAQGLSDFLLCDSQTRPCHSKEECCQLNCIPGMQGLLQGSPFCDKHEFVWRSDYVDYCSHFCDNYENNYALCDGNVCNESQCCDKRCVHEDRQSKVCSVTQAGMPADVQFSLLDNCANHCGALLPSQPCTRENGQVIDCDDVSCKVQGCISFVLPNHQADICGMNGHFYPTVNDYCHANALAQGGVIAIDTTCTNCATPDTCCETHCLRDHSPYTIQCNDRFETFLTAEAYCDSYCSFKHIDDDYMPGLCGNPPALCNEDQCCEKKCEHENNDKCNSAFMLVTDTEYCQQLCLDPIYDDGTFIDCPSGCDARHCAAQQCLHNLALYGSNPICSADHLWFPNLMDFCMADNLQGAQHTGSGDFVLCNTAPCSTKMECCMTNCLTDPHGWSNFPTCFSSGLVINNIQEACNTYCLSNSIDLLMDPTDPPKSATESQCCHQRCMASDPHPICDSTFNLVTDQAQLCAKKCSGEVLYTCGDDECDEKHCSMKSCLRDLELADYQGYTVCSNTLHFFYSLKDYCEAKYDNQGITGIHYCNGVPCVSQVQCCANDCLERYKPYQPKCDTSHRVYDTLERWCESYCPHIGVNPLMCSNNSRECTLTECCTDKCGQASDIKAKCTIDYLSVVTPKEYCAQKGCQPSLDLVECFNEAGELVDCTPKACHILKCLKEMEAYPYSSVCGEGTVRYDTQHAYCDAKYKLLVSDYIFCKNEQHADVECPDGDDNDNNTNDACCYQNCVNDHTPVFNGRCKQETHQWYDVKETFCKELCEDVFTVKLCSGHNCTKSQCCSDGCPPEDFHDVCSPDHKLILNATGFCAANCAVGVEYLLQDQVVSCGDEHCKLEDCAMKACLNLFDGVWGDKVCGSNQLLYKSQEEFCAAKLNLEVQHHVNCNFVLLKGCETAEKCRYYNCMDFFNPNLPAYQPRCDTATFMYYPTRQDWCEQHANVSQLEPYTCGLGFCSSEQCCQKRCEALPHRKVCLKSSFMVYQLSDNCTDQCNNVTVEVLECPSGDCTQHECDYLRCLNTISLSIYNENAICDEHGTWHDDAHSFCSAYLAANFSLGFDTCLGLACPSPKECCHQQCTADHLGVVFDGVNGLCQADTLLTFTDRAVFCDHYCGEGLEIFERAQCQGSDCTVTQCCEAKCVDKHDFIVCSSDMSSYWTPQQLCQHKCQVPSTDFTTCITHGDSIEERDCDSSIKECEEFKCAFDMFNGGYQQITVCGLSRHFYQLLPTYCKATLRDVDPELGFVHCNGKECLSETECCEHFCELDLDAFQTQELCDSEHHLHQNYKSYCHKHCRDRSLSLNQCADLNTFTSTCSSAQCSMDKCLSAPHHLVCLTKLLPYQLLTRQQYCTQQADADFEFEHCGERDCNERDCHVMTCLRKLAARQYTVDPICGDNSVFYQTQEVYCAQQYDLLQRTPAVVLDYHTCGTLNHCTDQGLCCLANCNASFQLAVFPTCDSDFEPYNNLTSFCQAYCPQQKRKFLATGCSSGYCTRTECCYEECMLSIYSEICDSNYNFLTKEAYCGLKCANPGQYISVTCSVTPCSPENCKLQKCIDDFVQSNYTHSHVCATSGSYYISQSLYCQAYMLNQETAYFNCNNCGSQPGCCATKCVSDWASTFTNRCLSNYVFYSGVQAYCEATCGNGSLTDLMCSGLLCASQESCCTEQCVAQANLAHCDANYNLLSEWDYCNYSCKGTPVLACSSGGSFVNCTQAICQNMKCNADFASIAGNFLCGDPLNSLFYWDTKENYCLLPVASRPALLTTCEGLACDSYFICCKARCKATYASFQGSCLSDYSVLYQTSELDTFCIDHCNALQANTPQSYLTCPTTMCSYSQCLSNKCTAENPNDKCTEDYQQMLTKEQYCLNLLTGSTTKYKECTANCSDGECKILGCIDELQQKGYVSENVCGRNSFSTATVLDDLYKFYASQRAYCIDKLAGVVDFFVLCYGEQLTQTSPCASEALCLHHQCRTVEKEKNSLPKCLDGAFYGDDESGYFNYCNLTSFGTDLCIGQATCTLDNCCSKKCQETMLFNVCLSDFAYTMSTPVDYCDFNCTTTDTVAFFACNGDCSVSDCNQQKCLAATTNTQICGSNGALYATDDLFCQAQSANSQLSFKDCATCGSDFDCCALNCSDALTVFTAYCLDSFVWVSTAETQCARQCNGSGNVQHCSAASTSCTQTTCCSDGCSAQLTAGSIANIPVLQVDPNNALLYIGFDTLCHATCQGIVPDKTCDLNQTIPECQSAQNPVVVTDCNKWCIEQNQNSLSIKYCSSSEEITQLKHCELYLCETGANYGETFHELSACDPNLCTSQDCQYRQCLNNCTADKTKFVCLDTGTQALVYESQCHLQCSIPTNTPNPYSDFTCTSTDKATCQYQCSSHRCQKQCLMVAMVNAYCGSDKVIYRSTCWPECMSITNLFDCKNLNACDGGSIKSSDHCEMKCGLM